MKKIYFILIFSCLISGFLQAQIYTEIFEGDWGPGYEDTRPCFADFDNDGLLDLIIGLDDGELQHLEQSEPGSNSFVLISKDIVDVSIPGRPSPEIIDIDNDGLLDLLVGDAQGYISHFEQTSNGANDFTFLTNNFNDISTGGYACPRLVDLDSDGLLDMLVGKTNGAIAYYQQDAINSNEFILQTDSFNNIDIGALATPCFADLDQNGLLDLLVGDNVGYMHHYEQDSSNSISFNLISDTFNQLDVGAQTCPIFTDLENDGKWELFVGNSFGFLQHYTQVDVGADSTILVSENVLPEIDVGNSSVPTFNDLDKDGLIDMIVGKNNGSLAHFEQEAEGSSHFTLLENMFNSINVGSFAAPVFLDIDDDGLLDLIIGEQGNNLNHFEQESVHSLSFTPVTDKFSDLELQNESVPTFTDLDNDGLLDMFVGVADGTIRHYEQDSLNSYEFILISDRFNDIDVTWVASPTFTDLDDDGYLDMIIGESAGILHHYEQDSFDAESFSLISDYFFDLDVGGYSKPVFVDINNDGLEDLIVGNRNGGIQYFQRESSTVIEEKRVSPIFKLHQNVPNPFQTNTDIRYVIHAAAKININIYNTFGQRIKILRNRIHQVGSYTVIWDGTDDRGDVVSNGLYICNVRVGDHSQSIKLLYLQ